MQGSFLMEDHKHCTLYLLLLMLVSAQKACFFFVFFRVGSRPLWKHIKKSTVVQKMMFVVQQCSKKVQHASVNLHSLGDVVFMLYELISF